MLSGIYGPTLVMKFENFMHMSLHLGWGDMLSQVAMPAIEQIVANHSWMCSEVTNDDLTEDQAVDDLLHWDSDDVFGLLGSDNVFWLGSEEESLFISLRNEIEAEMRSGASYQEAIAEWWK